MSSSSPDDSLRPDVPPPLDPTLDDRPAAAARDEIDALCHDQRLRWLAGERPTVESYLSRRQGLARQPDAVMELIYNEFLIREELGEAPPSADYFGRFPDHQAALARQLEVHRALQEEIETWDAAGSSRLDSGRLRAGPASSDHASSDPASSAPAPSSPSPSAPRPSDLAGSDFLVAGAGLGAVEGGPRFVIERMLGAGGMGAAYAAFDRRFAVRVALKMLHRRDAAALLRLKDEFRLLADLDHPNLVQLFELCVEPQKAYFTMELLEGRDFVSACAAFRSTPADPFPEREVRGALLELAAGLAALHAAGKVHCDLKPSNVLVDSRGRAVVLDFGMGRDLRAAAPLDLGLRGTIAYLPPERFRGGPASPAGDWYAVGCMLYEVLAGRRPFEGEAGRIVPAKLLGEVAPPSLSGSTASPELERLCLDWLSVDPARRPSAEEAVRRLGADSSRGFTPKKDALVSATPAAAPGSAAPAFRGEAGLDESEPLVGREEPLRRLHAALARVAAEGRGDRLLIHAPGGGGKSALAARFAAELESSGAGIALSGRCREHESIPFKAVDALVDDLARRLARLPSGEAAELLPTSVAALAELFPAFQRVPAAAAGRRQAAPIDPARRRSAAFEELGEVLAGLARRRPVAVWIDDVQWGDSDSARLLVYTMRAAERSPILWLACCRTERLSDSPFLSELRGALGPAAFREQSLPPLAEEDACRLALAHLPPAADAESASADARWIARKSGGSPFHVLELARSLSHSTIHARLNDDLFSPLESAAAADRASSEPAPSGSGDARMDEVLRRRIERTSPEARRLLEALALAGGPIPCATAAAAAGVDDPRGALAELRSGRLIRIGRESGAETAEPAHDRIREGAARLASPEEARRRHAALANALEAAPNPDPRPLARHFAAAGIAAKAHPYAEAAGRAAADAAAFDEAARHFRTALDQPGFEADRPRLERLLADALVGAGRGAEAGQIYQKLAAGRPVAEAAELHTSAVFHLVRAGRFRDGLEAFQKAQAGLGLVCPTTSEGKIRGYLWMRTRFAFRGLKWVERPAESADPADLARIDCCWTAGYLMGPTDVAGYVYYTALHNALAFRCGEPRRVARALACEALIHTYVPDRDFAASRRLLAQASALADRLEDPSTRAAVEMFRAGVWYCAGKWKEVAAATDFGIPFVRDACEGAAMELGWCFIYRLHALFYLGRWNDLRREAAACLEDARERGDLMLGAEVRCNMTNSVWLAADDPDAAERELQQAAGWRPPRLDGHVSFPDLIARVNIDLYRGDGDAAWRRLTLAWPRIAAAQQLRIEAIHVEHAHLRARAALASLAAGPPNASDGATAPHERALADDLGHLIGSSYSWTQGLALLHRASFASLRGRTAQAVEWLARAVELLDESGLALFAAAARWRSGELRGGIEGEALIEAARSRFLEEGVRRPEKVAAFLAPGFRRT